MTHGPEHQIEHAEHAAHAAHDPFDKRVTVSIAVVAAVLAAVTMLGHRAHNETLRYQTEASIEHSQSFNRWAAYQAQNIRKHMYDALATHLVSAGPGKDVPEAQKVVKDWRDKSEEYEKVKLPQWRKEAEAFESKGKTAQEKSHEAHAKGERFDLGELGLQLGVVLCSLAILSKQRGFWYAGLGCSALGLAVALTGVLGLFMGGHH